MKKLVFVLLVAAASVGCQSNIGLKQSESLGAGATYMETLQAYYAYEQIQNPIRLSDVVHDNFSKETIKTLEVAEVEIFEKNNVEYHVVFYTYSIGATIFREVETFVLYDGKFYMGNVYISAYKTSKEEEMLSEKIDAWKDDYYELSSKKANLLINRK